jgi:hypothetical protein
MRAAGLVTGAVAVAGTAATVYSIGRVAAADEGRAKDVRMATAGGFLIGLPVLGAGLLVLGQKTGSVAVEAAGKGALYSTAGTLMAGLGVGAIFGALAVAGVAWTLSGGMER